MNETILMGMARAFFACAYAEQAEECGQPLRGEIMDQLPDVIDRAAIHAARTLYMDMERYHKKSMDEIYADKKITEETFGHYAAMQSMGLDVGLFDYGIDLHIPSELFGSYSLEKDYFQPVDGEEE